MVVMLPALREHFTFCRVQGGKQRHGSVTSIIVGHALDVTQPQRHYLWDKTLDGAHRQCDHVVHLEQLFLQERLAVLYTNQVSIAAREQVHSGVEFIYGEVDALLALASCRTEL